jgi:hypothetical protein
MTMSATTPTRLVSTLALVIALTAAVGDARADDRGLPGPPPGAYAACDGRQAGAACSAAVGPFTPSRASARPPPTTASRAGPALLRPT